MNRIKQLRKANGYTLERLSKILNIGNSTLSQYENGKREANYETMTKIADIFHVSIDFLLGRDFEDPSAPVEVDNTITVYGRGMGMKKYKVSRKRLAAIQALLEDDDDSDDLDF